MKNIIVPTDFSDNSKAALEFAIYFAYDWKASITLIHVFIPPVVPANTPQEVYHSIMAEEEKKAEESLFQQIDWLKEKDESRIDSIIIKPMLIKESFVEGILKVAHLHHSNLIIIGSKGASVLKRILMGSNTVHLIQRTTIPVLAIPENAKFTEPKKIVLAVDLHQVRQNHHLLLLQEIAKMYDARVLIFYAKQNGVDLASLKNKAQNFIEDSLSNVQVYWFSTEGENIEKSIIVFVNDSKANMLVMLPRKKGLWQQLFKISYTQSIAFHPVIPLLVLPED